MECKCKVDSLMMNKLTLKLEGAIRSDLEQLKSDTEYRLKLVKWHEKRSLNSNAYCWLLCSKIAAELETTKEAIYEQMLQDYGVVDEEAPPFVVLADCDMSRYKDHFLWFNSDYLNGKKFDCYMRLKGSSEMDKREMAHFLNGLVFEAKQLGIETLPPEELERMKEQWGIEINHPKK